MWKIFGYGLGGVVVVLCCECGTTIPVMLLCKLTINSFGIEDPNNIIPQIVALIWGFIVLGVISAGIVWLVRRLREKSANGQ